TYKATMRGIKAAKPGREINVIGRVIESYAQRFGYNVVTDFTGHGVGTTFHNGLVVLHYDSDTYRDVLEPGMTLTVEPMINLGGLEYDIWDDGWTVQNRDGEFTAQFEHTLVITDDGNEILTIPDEQYAAGQLMLGS
ncbi:M24 family metallopeptidase, partial [Corynebacterium gottingense]